MSIALRISTVLLAHGSILLSLSVYPFAWSELLNKVWGLEDVGAAVMVQSSSNRTNGA